MNRLKLQLVHDDDGTCELSAEFQANGFAGVGSAWFGIEDLKEKATGFSAYPLSDGKIPCIEGGYWNSDQQQAQLKQEHLHISAYPLDSTGTIGLRVRASTPADDALGETSRHYAGVQLKITYEQMNAFSKGIVALCQGHISEFIVAEQDV